MPFTEAHITLEVDIWTSPDRAKCQYALELTVYGYESDQEPSCVRRPFVFLPTFDYGPIVVPLCDKWLKTVRETLFARDLISEDQAGLLIDLFLSYRAITARAPGVDDDTFPELLHQLIEGALFSTRGDTADDVLAAAVLHMHDLLPVATFHDPTDLSALTADPTLCYTTRANPALPDPTLTSASLTAHPCPIRAAVIRIRVSHDLQLRILLSMG
ncbi:hypothetical protein VTO73DRAFT_4231 [Trametes versicolor]